MPPAKEKLNNATIVMGKYVCKKNPAKSNSLTCFFNNNVQIIVSVGEQKTPKINASVNECVSFNTMYVPNRNVVYRKTDDIFLHLFLPEAEIPVYK